MAEQTGQQLIAKAGKLHESGKFKQAERIYRQLLKSNPNDLTLLRILGMLERDRRNLRAAIDWFMIAKQVSGNAPHILAELALTLEQSGQVKKAMDLAIEAHNGDPKNLSITIFFAKMCLARGLASMAGAAIEKTIHTDPDNIEACQLLSTAANSSGVLPVPLQYAQKSISLQPLEALSHATLATAHRMNGDLDESLVAYDHALSLDSTLPEAIAGKAEVLESLGRTDEAHNILRSTDTNGSVLIALAKSRAARNAQQPEAALKAIDSVIDQPLSAYHKSNMLMHRGRVLEELGQYDDAWDAWENGNKLHAGNFDLDAHVKLIDQIIHTNIQKEPLAEPRQGPTPVFIVGMFRSGTTLLEQILGAHPQIDAAGEVDQLLRYVNEKPYPECVTSPEADWQQKYLERLGSDANYCTDKMPMNYMHLGLINCLFPHATILHTSRNPLDTCVSCFANTFAASHAYTSDLGDLCVVYEQYQRLMQHWNDKFEGRIHEVPYESIVSSLEETVAGVLNHIGVEFDPAVLEFHNVRRIAITPSADQVRKPIYTSSVNRHKNFASHLKDLTRLQ